MSRKIRRVPPDWEHPRDTSGRNQPLFDECYAVAAQEWVKRLIDWENGGEERQEANDGRSVYRWFWEWTGNPPDERYYRQREWTEEQATHYQIYEDVSEGTPVSPVFATLDELEGWLVEQGHSEKAARRFREDGWAPSFFMNINADGTGSMSGIGIDALDWLPEKSQLAATEGG